MKLGKKVDAATEASIILKQEKLARALKTSSEISEKGLSNLMEKVREAIAECFVSVLQHHRLTILASPFPYIPFPPTTQEADMLDAWFYKFMQFQVHFFSEVGQQIMTLQGPSTRLADQLKKRNLDPSESAKILGDVAPETVVANPGWGTEHEEARLKGWFGIKGNKSPSTEEKVRCESTTLKLAQTLLKHVGRRFAFPTASLPPPSTEQVDAGDVLSS